MTQFRQQWCSHPGETAWLSLLVETLERLSDPEQRAVPCDPEALVAAKAHLGHPGCCHGLYGSAFSLRN